MATIFLDANILIDLYERDQKKAKDLTTHKLYISPLSTHILCYVKKDKIPQLKLNKLLIKIGLVSLTPTILEHALAGPTDDLEDNIQLHSAIEAECKYFFTRDKLLLKMAYFGKMQIINSLKVT